MGQKIHPKGLRIGVIENWDSFWFAGDQEYSKFLAEDIELRKYLKQSLYKAGISRIFIGRKANQIEVDLYTAVLGGEVQVPTLEGDVVLTIPPGSQPGQTFRLKGRGMPRLRHKDQHGDLFVSLKIAIPTDLSPEERQLFEKLANSRSR